MAKRRGKCKSKGKGKFSLGLKNVRGVKQWVKANTEKWREN
jgi:hypothetical protein